MQVNLPHEITTHKLKHKLHMVSCAKGPVRDSGILLGAVHVVVSLQTQLDFKRLPLFFKSEAGRHYRESLWLALSVV